MTAKSTRGPPTQHKVDKISRQEGWGTNVPSLDMVLFKWTPPKKIQVESDRKIMKMITTQKWPGLAIKDFGGEKGKGMYKCLLSTVKFLYEYTHVIEQAH